MEVGEIVYDVEYNDDGSLVSEYCVIIGREVLGGCQVGICGDIAKCPYVSHEEIFENEE